jgi:DNA-binding CsgD family transcriptional regulator
MSAEAIIGGAGALHEIRATTGASAFTKKSAYIGEFGEPHRTDIFVEAYEDPLINELLDRAGALRIADAAWLCRISRTCAFEELYTSTGAIMPHEIVDVLDSLRGPVNLAQASAPFRWLSGGQEYIVCAIGEQADSQIVMFLRVQRVLAADWPQVQRIAVRVQRLITLGMTIGGSLRPGSASAPRSRDSVAEAVVDLCPFGVVVLDADQNVLLANAAMQAFFAETKLIGRSGGKLAIFHPEDAFRVHVALRSALAARQPQTPHTVALTLSDGRSLLLSITKMEAASGAPMACIMVTDSTADYQTHIQPLAAAFALTPVETRLVTQLVEGRSVKEAALKLKLKVETARTYLKQVFQKTGTHRQIELVQLMKSGALPRLA